MSIIRKKIVANKESKLQIGKGIAKVNNAERIVAERKKRNLKYSRII
jgi:hypothetical protein